MFGKAKASVTEEPHSPGNGNKEMLKIIRKQLTQLERKENFVE